MSNVFSPGWAPHARVIDRGGTFAGGPMEAGEVAETYRDSLFVPSPPGNSPDCFRTYEAVIAGAVPLLDGRPTDYAWSGRFYAPGEGPGNGGGGEERV